MVHKRQFLSAITKPFTSQNKRFVPLQHSQESQIFVPCQEIRLQGKNFLNFLFFFNYEHFLRVRTTTTTTKIHTHIQECCPLSSRKENCTESSTDVSQGVKPYRASPILFSLMACGLLHLVISQRPKQIQQINPKPYSCEDRSVRKEHALSL